ncbi:hypothetical protein BKA83DRAFT_4133016 [Pisolithus microcarpus]|nr:hypothetical protein BKA83DRAFT_4133016 [Pisolithus microcarpus]
MGAARTVMKQDKQREATERWLSKPGNFLQSVRTAEGKGKTACCQEQDKINSAIRKCVNEDETTTCNPISTGTCGVSPDTEHDSYLHPSSCSELPPLKEIRQLIAEWQSEWGAESTWPKRFHEQLKRAQGRGWLATDHSFRSVKPMLKRGGGLSGF